MEKTFVASQQLSSLTRVRGRIEITPRDVAAALDVAEMLEAEIDRRVGLGDAEARTEALARLASKP